MTLCSTSLRLAGVSLRHKDRIRRHWAPEGLRLQRDNLQRFFQRDSVQLNLDPPRGVVGIKQHIDSRQLADRFVDVLGVFGQLQRDRNIRDVGQFDRAGRVKTRFSNASGVGATAFLRTNPLGFINHALGALYLLHGDETRGIDERGFLKLRQGLVHFPASRNN